MITVVIPTCNRADYLEHCLESLHLQEIVQDSFEVIVIDNGSTDHTAQIVKAKAASFINLQYLHEPAPGLHEGRHRGMVEARGEVLVFVDDDIEASPGWLAAISEAFKDPQVAMAGGNNLPDFAESPPGWLKGIWKSSSYEGGLALGPLSILELPGEQRPLDPEYVWGCNFAIRKTVLLEAGGFHPDGMPPELIRFRGDGETHVSNYVKSKGLKCIFHPAASVHHKVTPGRMTFEYFRQRGFNQGVSDSYTDLRGQDLRVQAPQKGRWYKTLRRAWRMILHLSPVQAQMRNAWNQFETGHLEGYSFHQKAYKEDQQVRDWVHKERYF